MLQKGFNRLKAKNIFMKDDNLKQEKTNKENVVKKLTLNSVDNETDALASQRMSKLDAAKFLGLDTSANQCEIENSYTKKSISMRGRNDEESSEYLKKLNEAYDVMRGYEPFDIRAGKQIAGKSKNEWKNIWDYGKWPLLAIVLFSIFIIFLGKDASQRDTADFSVAIFGDFAENIDPFKEDKTKFEEVLRQENPELVNPRISLNIIRFDLKGNVIPEATTQAAVSKRMLMETGAEVFDLLLLDKNQYTILVQNGTLYPLDDLLSVLKQKNPELYSDWIVPLKYTLDESVLPDSIANAEHVYGLDLSKNQYMNNLEIVGSSHIFAVSAHSKQEQTAKSVIFNLIDSIDEWNDKNINIFSAVNMDPKPSPVPAPEKEKE